MGNSMKGDCCEDFVVGVAAMAFVLLALYGVYGLASGGFSNAPYNPANDRCTSIMVKSTTNSGYGGSPTINTYDGGEYNSYFHDITQNVTAQQVYTLCHNSSDSNNDYVKRN